MDEVNYSIDLPEDFKIEHDKLLYEIEPKLKRMCEILKELPKNCTMETIDYDGFRMTLEVETK